MAPEYSGGQMQENEVAPITQRPPLAQAPALQKPLPATHSVSFFVSVIRRKQPSLQGNQSQSEHNTCAVRSKVAGCTGTIESIEEVSASAAVLARTALTLVRFGLTHETGPTARTRTRKPISVCTQTQNDQSHTASTQRSLSL